MAGTSLLDASLTYAFLRKLTRDFKDWQAFKTGVIDDAGKILVEPKDRTPEQKKSFRMFDLMVLKIKKLLAKIPGGSSKFATYTAALYLVTEANKDNPDFDEEKFTTFLKEEIVNTSSGVGNMEVPVIHGSKVFDIDFDSVWKNKATRKKGERYNKYLEDCDDSQEIRSFCIKNPHENIILRDKKTGMMFFFRRK